MSIDRGPHSQGELGSDPDYSFPSNCGQTSQITWSVPISPSDPQTSPRSQIPQADASRTCRKIDKANTSANIVPATTKVAVPATV